MQKLLEVFGPFNIPSEPKPKGNIKVIRAEHGRIFWSGEEVSQLKYKQGCYIFALRAGKGFTPWYVGKTKNSMINECFTPNKLNHYNYALAGRKGTPVMFFLTYPDNKKVVDAKSLKEIEKFMIVAASVKNNELLNIKNAQGHDWGIKGVIGSGQGRVNEKTQKFKRMMGL